MDQPAASSSALNAGTSTEDSLFSEKNILIMVLVGLLILSFIGFNLLAFSGNILQSIANVFGPVFVKVASMFGYSAGELVNTTSSVAADAAKLGVDIAEGTAHSIGDLLKAASKGGMDEAQKRALSDAIRSPHAPNCPPAPKPEDSGSDIQKSISSKKGSGGWCLVGEYNGARSCVAMSEHDKCMSGQVFPSHKTCTNAGPNANEQK
jgi:hypothetical protein